ncbi:putative DNA binding domain-containing protein [Mesorhizobium sp. VK25A]|uniref:DNA binding domain-containing protein n=1 Tax=Mesorhizobium vachelliae TaxID=3072309 RepID=A0ABU5ACW7_9HYPH|nr:MULTISPECIES: RNA-binding domain-containing protein [unclassified Mesorhizobium]MDX8534777.1 putative DNA binding domain-containing protein [Mesorhizobium sp. VK25D]MDX8547340.1 putative DNA binding domain-containing protein [Mesorhizobium sp. VK25A]
MPTIQELQPLLTEPREDLAAEYKNWLDLTTNEHKAVLAKAAIALANHGGGYIILGFEDQGHQLAPIARPANVPEISQDIVNAAIHRFATPEFHCELYNVPHPATQVAHPVIVVPGNMTEPVMSRRDSPGVISQNRCYVRKPGPRSEEPQTVEEWRALLRRCVLAGREDMLEAIRSIVSGRVETMPLPPNARDELHTFCKAARARWSELAEELPANSPGLFTHGYYEMGFSLVGSQPAPTLVELQRRLEVARRIRLTGWPAFLSMATPEWAPYPHENFVEAWVGRPSARNRNFEDSAHTDFWRASRDGKLYTIRGYTEDSVADRVAPGSAIDVTLPVWRVGEGILFATRFAETFEDVEAIAVECRFTGLNNRYLTSLNHDRAVFDDRVSHTAEITLTGQATLVQLRDNLTEFMHQLMAPLYERFDFLALSVELVDTELGRLRNGRF